MRRYGFMVKAFSRVMDSTTETMHREVRESVIKTAMKYGCTTT
jgi:hypothetical protein